MENFQFSIEKTPGRVNVTLFGIIDESVELPDLGITDETVELPELGISGPVKVRIDLEGVKGINSFGIRNWVAWLKTLVTPAVDIEFANVRPSMVFQFNMVMGCFPKGASISSIYLPMFCEKCDEDQLKRVAFPKATHRFDSSMIQLDEIRKRDCKDANCMLEPDYDVTKYFSFLNPKK